MSLQHMGLSSWKEIPGVEIELEGRGEELIYREAGREYQFVVSIERSPFKMTLHGGNYWDGKFPRRLQRLTKEEEMCIIPRLVAYLGGKGDPVEVRDE